MAQHLTPHLFIHIEPGLFEVGLENRIEVAAAMLEPQKPPHVVDAGGQEINLILGHAGVAGNQIHGGLHAVAEADKLQSRHPSQGPAAHGHRVGIVEEDGVRA